MSLPFHTWTFQPFRTQKRLIVVIACLSSCKWVFMINENENCRIIDVGSLLLHVVSMTKSRKIDFGSTLKVLSHKQKKLIVFSFYFHSIFSEARVRKRADSIWTENWWIILKTESNQTVVDLITINTYMHLSCHWSIDEIWTRIWLIWKRGSFFRRYHLTVQIACVSEAEL